MFFFFRRGMDSLRGIAVVLWLRVWIFLMRRVGDLFSKGRGAAEAAVRGGEQRWACRAS